MALKDVIGQENALRILRGAINRGRVASSYLFAGEGGVGKRFTAVNLAKALNCQSPVEGDACEECSACVKINAGTHPDFRVIKPEGEYKGKEVKTKVIIIDQIRDIEEIISLKPYEGGMKIVIVDDAEFMNAQAANAFLKTLEEPAPQSLIVLVSANPDWLPMTIRSRCSRVNFTPLSPEACEIVIRKNVPDIKKGNLDALVRLSMGRPGTVLGEDPVKERDEFMATMRKMLLREGRPTWRERSDMQRWLEMSLVFLRDMAVLRAGAGVGALLNEDIAAELKKMGKGASIESILECHGKLLKLGSELRFNPNKAVTWNYAGSLLEEAGISA